MGLDSYVLRNVSELSGGEAQRIKLASELSKRMTGKTMYIRLERKDHQSFENYLYGSDGSSIIVSLGMFAYRGRKAMINIEYQRGKTTAVDVTWERYDYKLDSDVAYTN